MVGCTYYLIGMQRFTVIEKIHENVLEEKSDKILKKNFKLLIREI